MGKPAARLTDNTAHGGLIMGPGCPTVLIGKMPAATMGDMHVCPMMTPAVPPIPHVGGPITLGSTGVLIGKKPAARLGDMCVCVGPPSTVIMGCMTVLIGEAGSGSQAGAAGAAAAAQAAKMKGPKSLEAFPAEEPGKTGEMHFIQSEFADAGGKVFQGAPYRLTDPDKKEPLGASSSEGGLFHDGFAKKGSFKAVVPELKSAKWAKQKIKPGEAAEFSVDVDLPEDVKEAQIGIFENRGNDRKGMALLTVPVEGKKVKGSWKPKWEEVASLAGESDAADGAPPFENPTYDFACFAGGMVIVSGPLKIGEDLEIELRDEDGKGVPNAAYELVLPTGETRKGKLDGAGKATIADLSPGEAEVRFPPS